MRTRFDRLLDHHMPLGLLLVGSLLLGAPLLLSSCDAFTDAPSAPSEVHAEVDDAEVRLRWQPMEDVARYVIAQDTTSPAQTPIDTTSRNVGTYLAAGLENGTTYYFRVRAISKDGDNGSFSEEVHATPESGALGYRLEPAYSDLFFERPTNLAAPSGTPSLVYVAEQEGIVFAVENRKDASEAERFADLRDRVDVWDPRTAEGLLGLAFHPDFPENSVFFVLYTQAGPNGGTVYSQNPSEGPRTVLSRIEASTRRSADPSTEEVLLTLNQPYEFHNGGQLAFGPDGYLYVSLGDGGSVGDPDNRAQNVSSLHGSILRIDVDRAGQDRPYGVPNDNPFANSEDARPEIYAYGFRNPWRFSFDREMGDLWAGDVGQDDYEEINVVQRGENYGWRKMEGIHCYEPATGCEETGLQNPIFEYEHTGDHHSGNHSVTGGFVYRDTQLPDLEGKYVYGDFISGRIWALTFSGEQAVENELLVHTSLRLATFEVDSAGRFLVTGVEQEYEEGGEGQVFHLVPPKENE